MELTHRVVRTPLARPFRIATGVLNQHETVVCELTHGGIVGVGEGAPAPRVTGETVDSVQAFLDRFAPRLQDLDPSNNWQEALARVHALAPEAPTARAALDLAIHDLAGKLQGIPARALYADAPAGRIETCITVSLDEPARMADEARAYRRRGFRALKLKLGDAAHDLDRVCAVRSAVPDASLRADANTGWTPDEAGPLVEALAREGVRFIEQPFPPGLDKAMADLSSTSPITIYADESVKDARDVERLAALGYRGGINLKIMKAGGIQPTLQALRAARERGFATQLGCNIETGIGIAAAAQLIGLLDHADLDGNILLAHDPYRGPQPVDGVLRTPAGPGLGLPNHP